MLRYLGPSKWDTQEEPNPVRTGKFLGKTKAESWNYKLGSANRLVGQPTDKDSDRYILIRYITRFSKSSVRKTFVWLLKDSKAELVQYEIVPKFVTVNSTERVHL